jgi:putative phosphoribosyl transferase
MATKPKSSADICSSANTKPFLSRKDGGQKLLERFAGRTLRKPLVLGIPRGGMIIADILAQGLGAELDIVLSAKLRAPNQPELAIGSVSEQGEIYLAPFAKSIRGVTDEYLVKEVELQINKIQKRKNTYRQVKPAPHIEGRSVIIVDDGIATGSSVIAAVESIKDKNPHEIIIATPYIPRDKELLVKHYCDELITIPYALTVSSVGEMYEDFTQVSDQEVLDVLLASCTGKPSDS